MRCPDCEAKALEDLRADLAAHPEAGLIFATVRLDPATGIAVVSAGDVECSPLALVAAADSLLDQAAERIGEHADHPETARFLAAIATVRDTLARAPAVVRH